MSCNRSKSVFIIHSRQLLIPFHHQSCLVSTKWSIKFQFSLVHPLETNIPRSWSFNQLLGVFIFNCMNFLLHNLLLFCTFCSFIVGLKFQWYIIASLIYLCQKFGPQYWWVRRWSFVLASFSWFKWSGFTPFLIRLTCCWIFFFLQLFSICPVLLKNLHWIGSLPLYPQFFSWWLFLWQIQGGYVPPPPPAPPLDF